MKTVVARVQSPHDHVAIVQRRRGTARIINGLNRVDEERQYDMYMQCIAEDQARYERQHQRPCAGEMLDTVLWREVPCAGVAEPDSEYCIDCLCQD